MLKKRRKSISRNQSMLVTPIPRIKIKFSNILWKFHTYIPSVGCVGICFNINSFFVNIHLCMYEYVYIFPKQNYNQLTEVLLRFEFLYKYKKSLQKVVLIRFVLFRSNIISICLIKVVFKKSRKLSDHRLPLFIN